MMRMESFPLDVLERIIEILPVKSLLRFKAVSKQWQSMIESRLFQERRLKQRQQLGDPDVLMVCVQQYYGFHSVESLRTLVLGSLSSVKIPTSWENTLYSVCQGSCDGLVFLYHTYKSCFVVNPTTRWHRTLPLSHLQQRMISVNSYHSQVRNNKVGFGKDKFTGTYKPVWLYSSVVIGREEATTCEVFDFRTNAWRYATASAPYRVSGFLDPVYVDGSLHWFTQCKETKVVSFDLHTEASQVISKAPFGNVDPYHIVMCNLDNHLCVSEMKLSKQVIWSFNSGNKTWSKMCSIDLNLLTFRFDIPISVALLPLALLGAEKKKLLFCAQVFRRTLVILDLETKSYDAAFYAESLGYPLCYFQSLISIL